MKKFFDSQGHEVCDVVIEGRGVDRYIAKATYLDDGSEVPEDELIDMADGECLCRDCLESDFTPSKPPVSSCI